MSSFPYHKPVCWEMFRNESREIINRRAALRKSKVLAEEQRREDEGLWWDAQKYVDQVVPAEFIHPSDIDTGTYRYQVYARPPPIQCPPKSLKDVCEKPMPVRYNVKRVAVNKPYPPAPYECPGQRPKLPLVIQRDPCPDAEVGRLDCSGNNNTRSLVPGRAPSVQHKMEGKPPLSCDAQDKKVKTILGSALNNDFRSDDNCRNSQESASRLNMVLKRSSRPTSVVHGMRSNFISASARKRSQTDQRAVQVNENNCRASVSAGSEIKSTTRAGRSRVIPRHHHNNSANHGGFYVHRKSRCAAAEERPLGETSRTPPTCAVVYSPPPPPWYNCWPGSSCSTSRSTLNYSSSTAALGSAGTDTTTCATNFEPATNVAEVAEETNAESNHVETGINLKRDREEENRSRNADYKEDRGFHTNHEALETELPGVDLPDQCGVSVHVRADVSSLDLAQLDKPKLSSDKLSARSSLTIVRSASSTASSSRKPRVELLACSPALPASPTSPSLPVGGATNHHRGGRDVAEATSLSRSRESVASLLSDTGGPTAPPATAMSRRKFLAQPTASAGESVASLLSDVNQNNASCVAVDPNLQYERVESSPALQDIFVSMVVPSYAGRGFTLAATASTFACVEFNTLDLNSTSVVSVDDGSRALARDTQELDHSLYPLCTNNNAFVGFNNNSGKYLLQCCPVDRCGGPSLENIDQDSRRKLCRFRGKRRPEMPQHGTILLDKVRPVNPTPGKVKVTGEPIDLECRPLTSCATGKPIVDGEGEPLMVCGPPSRPKTPEIGYGTYKIVGSMQRRARPDNYFSDLKLPPDLEEYREFGRRCPNYSTGRYDRRDPLNELLLPSDKSTGLLKGSVTPYIFCRMPKRKLPPLFEPLKVRSDLSWSMPAFVGEEQRQRRSRLA